MELFCHLLLLSTSLIHSATPAAVYYVVPDNNTNETMLSSNINTLQHYLGKKFASHSQLLFQQGQYRLKADLVISNIHNFTLSGNNSNLSCTTGTYASMMFINVTNFTIENFSLMNCGKDYGLSFNGEHVNIDEPSSNGSILLYNCTSAIVDYITVIVKEGNVGMFAVNVNNKSRFLHTDIVMDCSVSTSHEKQLNGVVLYYNDMHSKENMSSSFLISHFHYGTIGLCLPDSHYAMALLLFQKRYSVSITIRQTAFNDYINTGALYYYGETCGLNVHNNLMIQNCEVSNNSVVLKSTNNNNTNNNRTAQMFYILLYNFGCFDSAVIEEYCSQQYNKVIFTNCVFSNNSNISSMIYVVPASSRALTGNFTIHNSVFCNNMNSHFFNMGSDKPNVWQFTNFVLISNTTITSNDHGHGKDLISATNGWIKFMGPVVITQNKMYENIARLYLAGVVFECHVTLSHNLARRLFDASYFLIKDNTTIDIFENIVYAIVKQAVVLSVNSDPICPVQFYSETGNLDNLTEIALKLKYKIRVQNNKHLWSRYMLSGCQCFGDCVWLAGTAFRRTNASNVLSTVLNITNNPLINESTLRQIPMSICPCKDENSSCYTPTIGKIFPGQTINVSLRVPNWHKQPTAPFTFVVTNTNESKCEIVHTSQLSQMRLKPDCNNYSYTLWPIDETATTCKLYIGLSSFPNDVPETFYVTIDSCPKGFTRQINKKACDCDPVLQNSVLSIESCNLDNGTILHRANSWIFADVAINGTHVESYRISTKCPFDYCLSHSSYIDLSQPDTQCQFNRSGVLCGQCQQGLSAVFGSSQCKRCFNRSLFIIAPMTVAGIVLVMVLFIFNLTITDGTINPFIFYVNIISINFSLFFPKYPYIVNSLFLSLLNLDLGIEACFFDGMDDYHKALLQLCFPSYLIIIATCLIVGSRYSNKIQRFTARRALPVLATLFLLSYTKILLTVCQVLFYYSYIIHIPNNTMIVVWVTDVSAPLVGKRFLLAFIPCVIIMVILLFFNFLLLLARRLSRFKAINTFKPLLDAYFGPYKDTFYYWNGLQLLIRAIFFGTSGLNDKFHLTIGIIILGCLLCKQSYAQPFKSKFKNFQESFILLNLHAVYVFKLLWLDNDDAFGLIIVQVLIALVLVNFVVSVIAHCVILKCSCYNKLAQTNNKMAVCFKRIFISSSPIELVNMEDINNQTSGNYHEFQDSLIALDS